MSQVFIPGRSLLGHSSPLVQFSPKRFAGQTQSRDPTPPKHVYALLIVHRSTTEMEKKSQFYHYLIVITIEVYKTVKSVKAKRVILSRIWMGSNQKYQISSKETMRKSFTTRTLKPGRFLTHF